MFANGAFLTDTNFLAPAEDFQEVLSGHHARTCYAGPYTYFWPAIFNTCPLCAEVAIQTFTILVTQNFQIGPGKYCERLL